MDAPIDCAKDPALKLHGDLAGWLEEGQAYAREGIRDCLREEL